MSADPRLAAAPERSDARPSDRLLLLSGRSLLLARVAWFSIALLVVGTFVAGEISYLAEIQTTVCAEGAKACLREGLLTPENVQELRDLGLSAGFYAAFDAAINAVFVAVGALIFWRRSDERMALLVALFLVEGNLFVSLVATGVVAVLFAPLRDRLQRGVNRLTYGERDEPYGVLSRLGRRLEGTLAPEAVLPAIVEDVARALRLGHVAIWLAGGDALRLGATHGAAPPEMAVRDAGAVEALRHAPDGLRPEDLVVSSPYGAVLEACGVGLALPLKPPGRARRRPVHDPSWPRRGVLPGRPATIARPRHPVRRGGSRGPARDGAPREPGGPKAITRAPGCGPGGGAPPCPARPARRARPGPGEHAAQARSLPGGGTRRNPAGRRPRTTLRAGRAGHRRHPSPGLRPQATYSRPARDPARATAALRALWPGERHQGPV